LRSIWSSQIPPTEVPDLRFPVAARILAFEDRPQASYEVFPQELPEVLIRVNLLLDILFRFPLELRDDAFLQLFFLLFKAESHFIIDRLVPAEQLSAEFVRHTVPGTEGTGKVPDSRI
jgi:hypothetical protein